MQDYKTLKNLAQRMYQWIQFAISLRFRFFGCSLTSAPSFPSFWQVRWAAAWFDISCLEKRGRGWKLMISHYPVERDQSRPSDISISSPAHPPTQPTSFLILTALRCTSLSIFWGFDKQHLQRFMSNGQDQPHWWGGVQQYCNVKLTILTSVWYHPHISHVSSSVCVWLLKTLCQCEKY